MPLSTDTASQRPDPTTTDGPATRLLGDATLRAVVTSEGTGSIQFEDADLTRFRGDALASPDGLFVYLRDSDSGAVWSAGRQPVHAVPDRYHATLGPDAVAIEREDHGIETRTVWRVEGGAFVGRLTLANRSDRPRSIEVTTFGEVALHARAADAGHPAFSKLFVETEAVDGLPALLARRRPRSPHDAPLWLAHAVGGDGEGLSWETDRMRFIGRGRDASDPAALDAEALSGTVGAVLDPVVSLRRVVRLDPGASAHGTVALAGARSRDEALARARQIVEASASEAPRAAASPVSDAEALAQSLVRALVYGDPAARDTSALADLTPGDWSLGRFGLDPSRPLVVVRVASSAGVEALGALEAARDVWSDRGLDVSLVALVDEADLEARDGVVSLDAATLSDDERAFLLSAAHVVADDALPRTSRSSRTNVDDRRGRSAPAEAASVRAVPGVPSGNGQSAPRGANGLGGFSVDGSEYVVHLVPDDAGRLVLPPLPWANVIANEAIGCIVSERGSASTWSANSRLNRLTPWANDPVSDPYGEALYVREEPAGGDGEATGGPVWSPMGGPAPPPGAVEVRHGFGVSTWRSERGGLAATVTHFVAREDAVRLQRVQLENRSGRARRVSVASAVRLVLGALSDGSDRFVVTERAGDAILAQNPTAGEFAERVAVASVVAPAGADVSLSADLESFQGGGGVSAPRGLGRTRLDGAVGAGLSGAVLLATVDVPPGETVTVTFLLGQGDDRAGALALRDRYRTADEVEEALGAVAAFWRETTQALQIETPEPALDRMINGWLVVQNLACRIWGRSAYSQSGGAYGYRDQLQDASAFSLTHPALTRAQILRHASHQFPEGDVLHWWHPPLSKGIRTRFADDLLWLPLLASHYVEATGDAAVWDEETPFVDARALEPGEDEAFVVPTRLDAMASVYEHACLAIDRSLAVGANGLPLMGVGDWNDGMNRVGREGRGESVWMGFFLFDILGRFAPLAEARGDADRAARYAAHREHLREALNTAGWDGQWYRRATYDDGTWLGSAQSDECQIDTLAQAWAVLSGAAPPERAAQALDALEERLVDEDAALIRLLTPAFDATPHDPGYIKGYVPGVRENGGQYTHAALWAVRALAEAGRCERAAPLLAMLSPVSHTDTPEAVATYKAEPYVIAADVYGVEPHVGRGGWTWYTGSAGWMWRVAVESVLGLTVENGTALVLRPCIPDAWPGFSVRYRRPDGSCTLDVRVTRGDLAATLDGEPLATVDGGVRVPLPRDGAEHVLSLTLPTASTKATSYSTTAQAGFGDPSGQSTPSVQK